MALLSAGVCGCAALGLEADENDGMKVVGDGRRAVVYMPWDAMDWSMAAARYCAGYGRFAKPTQVEPHRAKISCVDTLDEVAKP